MPRFVSFASTDLGGREYQQDSFINDEGEKLYAVFDGHGSEGGKAAVFAKNHFKAVFQQALLDCSNDIPQAFTSSFRLLNEKMVNEPSIDSYLSGTTALVVYIKDDIIYTANAGDSRVVLLKQHDSDAQKFVAIPLSTDHTCNNPTELERVKSKGARVERALTEANEPDGPLRIYKGTLPYPGIVVTRSLGDTAANPRLGVICDPEITIHKMTSLDRYIIVATDGLWDGLDAAQLVDAVGREVKKGPQKASPESLSQTVMKKSLKGMQKKLLDDNNTNVFIEIIH